MRRQRRRSPRSRPTTKCRPRTRRMRSPSSTSRSSPRHHRSKTRATSISSSKITTSSPMRWAEASSRRQRASLGKGCFSVGFVPAAGAGLARAFVDRRIIEPCVDANEIERPYKSGQRYVAFVDPSGGSSDSMTLGIGHRDKDAILVDVVREIVAPFDPESATEEFSNVLKSYQLTTVTGDRYAGEWPQQAFRKRGIRCEPSEQPKNALYTDPLPKLN